MNTNMSISRPADQMVLDLQLESSTDYAKLPTGHMSGGVDKVLHP